MVPMRDSLLCQRGRPARRGERQVLERRCQWRSHAGPQSSNALGIPTTPSPHAKSAGISIQPQHHEGEISRRRRVKRLQVRACTLRQLYQNSFPCEPPFAYNVPPKKNDLPYIWAAGLGCPNVLQRCTMSGQGTFFLSGGSGRELRKKLTFLVRIAWGASILMAPGCGGCRQTTMYESGNQEEQPAREQPAAHDDSESSGAPQSNERSRETKGRRRDSETSSPEDCGEDPAAAGSGARGGSPGSEDPSGDDGNRGREASGKPREGNGASTEPSGEPPPPSDPGAARRAAVGGKAKLTAARKLAARGDMAAAFLKAAEALEMTRVYRSDPQCDLIAANALELIRQYERKLNRKRAGHSIPSNKRRTIE